MSFWCGRVDVGSSASEPCIRRREVACQDVCVKNHALETMSNFGRSWFIISSLVNTISLGILLTRFAPLATAYRPAADMPERFERIDPASEELDPGSRNLGGGAKSRPVKAPDLRSMCGLGITARSSKELASGVWGRTAGLKGRGLPRGLSGLRPFCLSRKDTGGAKSIGSNTIEFSVSLAGVGSDARADGGGMGFLGPGGPMRPLIDDMLRGA